MRPVPRSRWCRVVDAARGTGIAAIAAGWLAAGSGRAHAQFNGSFAIDPVHLKRENWLDWRAYQPPPEWRLDAYAAPNALQGSVGSLSQIRFYQAIDIRLEKDIGAYATILYTQTENSFFRSNPPYREAELRAGAGGWYGSVIGFPEPDKSQASQGLAVAWGKRTDANWVRLSQLQELGLYNEKTTGTARFAADPVLNRLQARVSPSDRLRVELDYRDEPTARLISPDLAQQQTYAAEKFDGWADWRAREDLWFGMTVSDNTERRRLRPDSVTAATPELRQTLTWGWTEARAVWTAPDGGGIALALVQSVFENAIESTDPTQAYHWRLRTTQAYALWQIPRSAWFRWTLSLQVGEVRLFHAQSSDDAERRDAPTIQAKFGFGAILTEARSYRVWLLSTWAPDAISGQKWDGGNLQFQLFF